MVYTFEISRYVNKRYRDAFCRLAACELRAMLQALSIDCEVRQESLGGAAFLSFDCRPLKDAELTWLSRHSALCFLAVRQGSALTPLSFTPAGFLEEDLPEVLKYKGKTASSFTRMMLNMALSQTPFALSAEPLTLMDPICGKGTSCFSALQLGMNAIGLDQDQKAIREASEYFARYLKMHFWKHTLQKHSETAGKHAISVDDFVFADTKEHFQQGETRFLRLASGDTSFAPSLCRRRPVHLMIADFPYGVQHAPRMGHRPESFQSLLSRSLPEWKKALLPGGALAVSFNTLTFPYQQVYEILLAAGFSPCSGDIFSHLRHEVEQAVVRDFIIAINPSQKEENP